MNTTSLDWTNGREDTRSLSAEEDTIAAIATPPGVGGLGIVRISGPDAFRVGRAVFRRVGGDRQEVPPSHLLTYGHAVDASTGEILDEVLAAFMRAPRTYTREDVVEISAHGGPLILRRILEQTLAAGARLARAGEMTLRAFLNGRLDLAQAEAVMALINAESDAGRRLALRQLHGELSARVGEARTLALTALAHIEASIDFPEEEVPLPDPRALDELVARAEREVTRLLAGADRGRIVREGLRVAIVGRPNVGKSSLLNALLRTERAIVTPIAGTTRDTVEERANIGGVALHLIDTAGLTPTDDPIERIGVERSRAAARGADLLLFVLDGSQPLDAADYAAASEIAVLLTDDVRDNDEDPAHQNDSGGLRRPVIVVNKADLAQALSGEDAAAFWPGAAVVHTSAMTRDGAAGLEDAIAMAAFGGQALAGDVLVASARHSDALRQAAAHLGAARHTLAAEVPLDFVSVDLRAALDALGEITGETATDDLLDRIFAEFCIGK